MTYMDRGMVDGGMMDGGVVNGSVVDGGMTVSVSATRVGVDEGHEGQDCRGVLKQWR